MSKGSGSEKSQGTLECQGEWELKAGSLGIRTLESAAGSQVFVGIETLYRKKGHRESGSQGCSRDRVPSEVSLCKDPPGAASAATTRGAGTNDRTESRALPSYPSGPLSLTVCSHTKQRPLI